jgi:hypothetical protein
MRESIPPILYVIIVGTIIPLYADIERYAAASLIRNL